MQKNNTQDLRNLRKSIGDAIHQHRVERKMTLRKLSQATGIGIEKLDQYEIGKNQIQFETLMTITRQLHIKIPIIFG